MTPAGNQSQRREIMLLSVGKRSLLTVHDLKPTRQLAIIKFLMMMFKHHLADFPALILGNEKS